MKVKPIWCVLLVFALFLPLFVAAQALALDPPKVLVMPSGDTNSSAYTWVGKEIKIWGKVYWGSSSTGTYSWDINNDGTPDFSGSVSNAKSIECKYAYATAGLYEAKLTVTDGNGLSDSAIVRIQVLPAVTKDAQIQLAIERGLKWLYDRQIAQGGSYIYWVNYSSIGAETASAMLAFENRGHKPYAGNDAAGKLDWERSHIYAESVHNGLDYAISTLSVINVGTSSAFDGHNSNGLLVADNASGSYGPYKIGMYMMALIGAGDIASGAPDKVATTGPAGIIGRTYKELVGDMIDFCDYAQNPDWAGSQWGGWRYSAQYGSSDNSACQWCAIGMDAAEMAWGITTRAKLKVDNKRWTDYSQYFDGRFGYTCPTCTGTGGFAALTGSGICELSWQGLLKNDPKIILAGDYLKNDKGTGITYYMYAVAKGARIAKIDNGSGGKAYSEIELLGSAPGWDWYSEFSTYLIDYQNADGGWYNWGYTYAVLDTAFAVEILTKNVFTLRPVADITASPNPTPANSPVNFDISGSYHQDSTKILVNWAIDVNNDGTNDLSGTFPVSGPIAYAGYPDTGSDHAVIAKLTVCDNSTPVECGTKTVTVNISSAHVAPVANAGGPYKGTVGQPITFNGSASYSPNAGPPLNVTIVKYEWDLDGNGTFETNGGSSPTVQKTWAAPYSGLIGLKVTDSMGATATTTVYTQVFVVDLRPETYVQVSQTRISTYMYQYTYKFNMHNIGNGNAKNVKCTLDTWPAQMVVVDGQVTFGDINAGQVVTSQDTFSFKQDRRYPIANSQLKWKLEYDDETGTHWAFVNFPLI